MRTITQCVQYTGTWIDESTRYRLEMSRTARHDVPLWRAGDGSPGSITPLTYYWLLRVVFTVVKRLPMIQLHVLKS